MGTEAADFFQPVLVLFITYQEPLTELPGIITKNQRYATNQKCRRGHGIALADIN